MVCYSARKRVGILLFVSTAEGTKVQSGKRNEPGTERQILMFSFVEDYKEEEVLLLRKR